MKNSFSVVGDTVTIELPSRNGTEIQRCLISLVDLPLVSSISGTWRAHWSKQIEKFYARTSLKRREKDDGTVIREILVMHTLILGPARGFVVDHINHDGLDNRRGNIRVVSYSVNSLNLTGANASNKSCGIRGVSLHRKTGKWQVSIAGRYRGLFPTIEGAGMAAAQAINEATAAALGVGL